MSKLRQLLSYLSQPDATELVFKSGAQTMLMAGGRNVPVTVTALGLAGIRRFFDGTPVAERLGRASGTHETEVEIDGQRYVCKSTSDAGKLEVRVRLNSQREASRPASQRAVSGAYARVERVSSSSGRNRDTVPQARDHQPRARIDEPARRHSSRTDARPVLVREEPRPSDSRSRTDLRSAGVMGEPRPSESRSRTDLRSARVREEPRSEPVPRADSSRMRIREEEPPPRAAPSSDAGPARVEPEAPASRPAPTSTPPQPEPDPATGDLPPPPAAPASAADRPLGLELVARRPPRPAVPRIDAMLRAMLEQGASDLHLCSGSRPMVRVHGKMQALDGYSVLRGSELSSLLLEIIDDPAYEDFVHHADADFAHAVEGLARFRSNYFADRHGIGAVFRQIPMEILTPDKLGLPDQVLDLCWLSKGLVLVTGPTGSGKSTTLAALIDFINRNRDDHIITIEDPIEFVHENKRCLINQREVGRHTRSFKAALRAALREDPDVILVGELRDLETVAIALETAETGHLVFGTLHTTTAPSTVDRIIDQFPGDQQSQIRTMLGESLRGVIGQTLLRRKAGGRVAAYEILLHTSAVGNLIREGKTHQLKNTMQVSKHLGMQNLNDHLIALVKENVVEAQEAYVKSVDKQNLREMYKKAGIHVELPVDD